MSEQELRELAATTWAAVSVRAHKRTGSASAIAKRAPKLSEMHFDPTLAKGKELPVLRHLDEAVSSAKTSGDVDAQSIAERVSQLRDALPWTQNSGYTDETVGAHFLRNYGYGLLTGPTGPLCCPYPFGGYILLGPNLTYPNHKHAPREVYLILTPGAKWRLDNGEWFSVQPGDLVFHDSWQLHATQVSDVPFLAFVAWLDAGVREGIEVQRS